MKITTYQNGAEVRVGIITEKGIIDTGDKYRGPNKILTFLEDLQYASEQTDQLLKANTDYIATESIKLLAPIQKPNKFFGVSLNYADHIEETGRDQPEYPTFFNKQNSCVIGPGEAIHRPNVSEKLDYEGELGIVIGRHCRHVTREEARTVIAGYTIVNDVSVRDWQIRSHTWTLGKSFDTHGPTGPWIVTADEIRDPHALDIKTWVNDELRQSFNTRHLIFDCYFLVEYLSTVMTLEPGDIIATGTGSGVGVKMKPRGYMKPGDSVKIEIEKIGTLENPVIQEPETTKFIR